MNDIYDHAPECDVAIWLERAIETDAPRWLGVPDDVACQCQKLRACEQRVDRAADEPMKDAYNDGYSLGYDAALDAAWEAVLVVPVEDEHGGLTGPEVRSKALAAIDTLREEMK